MWSLIGCIIMLLNPLIFNEAGIDVSVNRVEWIAVTESVMLLLLLLLLVLLLLLLVMMIVVVVVVMMMNCNAE